MATAAPYDDGSSTESEYYFDPREEAEEEAACAWAHEHIVPKTHEPLSHGNEDSTVIKQEYSAYDAENITLPQGSEWSHGAAASTVYDNAVQQALAMAQELTGVQREDPLTDDTLNSNASPIEKKKEHEEKQEKNMAVLKKKEVEVKPKLVSLKSVKAQTPPASVTKAVAVGLRRSPSRVKGASSEMRKELSVARSQWKSTESQTSSSQKPSPRHIKCVNLSPKRFLLAVERSTASRRQNEEEVIADRHQLVGESEASRRQVVKGPIVDHQVVKKRMAIANEVLHQRDVILEEAQADFALMKDEAPDRDHHSTITTQEGDRVEVTNDLVALRRPERIIRRAEAEVAVVAGIAMAAMTSGSIVTRARAMTREIYICVVQATVK
ncbi:hypothetical protein PC128_g8734 [Phytophthora cactorum]|nr:hypothetical protein PC128_g8734 [Phytophthora cactorum]